MLVTVVLFLLAAFVLLGSLELLFNGVGIILLGWGFENVIITLAGVLVSFAALLGVALAYFIAPI